jgi:hypothetical protein
VAAQPRRQAFASLSNSIKYQTFVGMKVEKGEHQGMEEGEKKKRK